MGDRRQSPHGQPARHGLQASLTRSSVPGAVRGAPAPGGAERCGGHPL